MAIKIRFCPRCMNIIHRKDTKCTECGMLVSKMVEMKEKEEQDKINAQLDAIKQKSEELKVMETSEQEEESNGIVVDTRNLSGLSDDESLETLNDDAKETKSAKKKKKSKTENQEDSTENSLDDNANKKTYVDKYTTQDNIDFSSVGTISFEGSRATTTDSGVSSRKRHKHKTKTKKNDKDKPEFSVDEDGSYNIDTSDVTFLDGVEKPTASVRKARGDMPKQEKIEWWEIYKWADRMLAKRKIMKEVNKASRKTPAGINTTTMMVYCLLLGWMGAHNFYAGNKKKGWTIVIFDAIVALTMNIPVLYKFMGIFVGGGLAFAVLSMWIYDFISLIFGKYRYRISKEEFISNLNVDTRAKLGKKYVGFDKTVFKAKEQARLEKLNKKKNKKAIRKAEKLEKAKAKLEAKQALKEQTENSEEKEEELEVKSKKKNK